VTSPRRPVVTVVPVNDATLARIPLFAGLDAERRDALASVCEEIQVEPGTVLTKEGDFGFAMFAIVEGSADVLQGGQIIRALGAGSVFGEIAILSGGRRTATVVATAPTKLITVLNRDVWRLENDSPDVGASLRAAIADCLDA
jgi:CRP-like cAMP-binding protein